MKQVYFVDLSSMSAEVTCRPGDLRAGAELVPPLLPCDLATCLYCQMLLGVVRKTCHDPPNFLNCSHQRGSSESFQVYVPGHVLHTARAHEENKLTRRGRQACQFSGW